MKLTRNLLVAFVLGIVLAVIADVAMLLTDSQKSDLWGGTLVGYWAALGLLSFLAIIGVSKLLGSLLLRSEDYYDEQESEDV